MAADYKTQEVAARLNEALYDANPADWLPIIAAAIEEVAGPLREEIGALSLINARLWSPSEVIALRERAEKAERELAEWPQRRRPARD